MKSPRSLANILVLMTVINLSIVFNRNNSAEGFFLDLICASRIDALERQVSQLVGLMQANNANNANNGNNFANGRPNLRGLVGNPTQELSVRG